MQDGYDESILKEDLWLRKKRSLEKLEEEKEK